MLPVIVAVLAGHLYLVAVSATGPILVAWCDFFRSPGDETANRGARWLSMISWLFLIVGSLIGVLSGVLVWSDEFRQVLGRLHSKIHWGGAELCFSVALSGIVAFWWRRNPGATGMRRRLRGFLGLLSGTNLLYHFSLLFFVMKSPDVVGGEGPINAALFREYMSQGLVLSKTVHFVMVAFILVGMTWIAAGATWLRYNKDDQVASRLAIWGGRVALVPAVLQLLVGIWVVTQMAPLQMKAIMGADAKTTAAFVLSFLLSMWLMHLLAKIALGKANRRKMHMSIIVTMVILMLMLYVSKSNEELGKAATMRAPAGTVSSSLLRPEPDAG